MAWHGLGDEGEGEGEEGEGEEQEDTPLDVYIVAWQTYGCESSKHDGYVE